MRKSRCISAASVLAGLAISGSATAAPDVVLCQLYDFSQFSSDGTARGLALATTSWNIGTTDLIWFANPDARHPFIAMNMYRKEGGRFEQIGTSWVKHGFFALANLQCDMPNLPNCTFEPGHGEGDYLGQGCTDTYDAFLNAFGLGPRYEINPWTGAFDYNTSLYNTGGFPTVPMRQLRVQDDAMNPAMHLQGIFYMEGYYVHFQDENPMNNAAWKQVTPVRDGSGNYTFTSTPVTTLPTWGFAIDAWNATQTVVAEQVPVVKGVSPDGRCILAYKVTQNGPNSWHYEYAMQNVDMDRQVDSFSIPIPAGVNVSNIGFHAPTHTETKAYPGGPAIDNAQWTGVVSGGNLTWTTTTNPLRWGTLYNFRFDADTAPTNVNASVGLFRAASGRPDDLSALIEGPSGLTPVCPGDVTGPGGVPDGQIDVDDLNAILSAFGSNVGVGSPLDLANNDGIIDVDDLNVILGAWGQSC
ncbi:MAG: hypothetical protein H6812_04235 [Phycisphaeraceae bacterium]|nr:hypothetical protein [Phycisphaerales bacterium]MCB9842446.1 hypothetical protein [Phycisphaeraceae bacterium]